MHNALFVSWGHPVRGREPAATKVFGEWVEMLGGWQTKGTIKSFTPCFLNPTGGTLGGFFLIEGAPSQIDQLHGGEELRRAITRAQLIVDHVLVTRALTGDEIGKQMAVFSQNAAELSGK